MRQTDRGSVSVVVVTLTFALMMLAGLVHDGGRVIAARREADAVANAAARAGVQGMDETALRTGGGVSLDRADVARRVERYLATSGFDGDAVVDGELVIVRVHRSEPLAVLSALGLTSTTVEGSGQARAVRAIKEGA